MFDLNDEIERQVREIIGAAIEVHRALGPGFLESVYEKALSHELGLRAVSHTCQAPARVLYKNVDVGEGRIDLLVDRNIVVELKTVEVIADIHRAQVISYLKATGIRVGLLINFNVPVLKEGIRRIML